MKPHWRTAAKGGKGWRCIVKQREIDRLYRQRHRNPTPADPPTDEWSSSRPAQVWREDNTDHSRKTAKAARKLRKKARDRERRIATILAFIDTPGEWEVKPRYATDDAILGKAGVMRIARRAGRFGTLYLEQISDEALADIRSHFLSPPVVFIRLEDLEDQLLIDMGYGKDNA